MRDDTSPPDEPSDLIAHITAFLKDLDAIAPLLPHLLRLLALAPRAIAIGRAALEEARSDAELADAIGPLSDAVIKEAAAITETLVSNDALLVDALEQFTTRASEAAQRPEVAAALDATRDRLLDGADGLIARMLDRALTGDRSTAVDGVRVFEVVVDRMARRALDMALDAGGASEHPHGPRT